MQTEDQRRASLAVGDALALRGGNNASLTRDAHVDKDTVGKFLDGTSWPRRATLAKIEGALGWAVGTTTGIAEGRMKPPSEAIIEVPEGDLDDVFIEWVSATMAARTAELKWKRARSLPTLAAARRDMASRLGGDEPSRTGVDQRQALDDALIHIEGAPVAEGVLAVGEHVHGGGEGLVDDPTLGLGAEVGVDEDDLVPEQE